MKHIKLEKVLNFDFFSKNEDQYRILQPIKLSRLYVYLWIYLPLDLRFKLSNVHLYYWLVYELFL